MVDLPFKAKPHQEMVEIGNEQIGVIELPKYGSLLCNEELVLVPTLRRLDEQLKQDPGFTLDAHLWAELALIGFRRVQPKISLQEVQTLPLELNEQVGQFILDERNRWAGKKPKGRGGRSTGRSTSKTSTKATAKSSGGSKTASQATNGSTAKTSATSPST
ncbi:MAG: hypothetical protein AAGF24_02170 [Cyanobacteria bacterium P01_H01_bin.121]